MDSDSTERVVEDYRLLFCNQKRFRQDIYTRQKRHSHTGDTWSNRLVQVKNYTYQYTLKWIFKLRQTIWIKLFANERCQTFSRFKSYTNGIVFLNTAFSDDIKFKVWWTGLGNKMSILAFRVHWTVFNKTCKMIKLSTIEYWCCSWRCWRICRRICRRIRRRICWWICRRICWWICWWVCWCYYTIATCYQIGIVA